MRDEGPHSFPHSEMALSAKTPLEGARLDGNVMEQDAPYPEAVPFSNPPSPEQLAPSPTDREKAERADACFNCPGAIPEEQRRKANAELLHRLRNPTLTLWAAAALLLAGDAPSLTHHRRSVGAGVGGGRHKVRRYLASKAIQSRRFPTGKSVIAK
jgi:hypothetical protein